MLKLVSFIKRESVLCISWLLAVISLFFAPKSADYLSYIDFKTLALLFCLMAVMSGFSTAGLFDFCANRLLQKAKSTRRIQLTLVLLCFFFSAVITNDVALITFVPFAITVLTLAKKTNLIPMTVILQTVAANMGSCLTPIGNPQNIYIFSISKLSFSDFLLLMLPYSAITLIILLLFSLFTKNSFADMPENSSPGVNARGTLFFSVLFLISILAVFEVINYVVCFIIVAVALLIFERQTILKVDYSLLLTFVGFFIFVGNMGNVPFIHNLIEKTLFGKEIIFSALASQIISNVPAALLLSGFTDNMQALLVGVNIGGLGTLIASMASLISYKYVAVALPDKKGRYIIVFSLVNFALLILMILISFIL